MMASDISGIPETLAPRPSPLNIPELLHRIFYFFDDFELTRHVLPVCRLWFLLNQHLIAREAHFDEAQPPEELERVLLGLPWATRLCWSGGVIKRATRTQQRRYRRQMTAILKDKYDDFMDNRFLKFRPVTGKGKVVGSHQYIGEGGFYTYGSGGLDGLIQGSKAPLRELLVYGNIVYEARVIPLLPFLSTLRRLELRIESSYLDLAALLTEAPSLEALIIQGNTSLIGDLGSKHFKRHRGDQPLLLRSIIFEEVRYPQASVEIMVTMTPHLRELVLCAITLSNFSWSGSVAQNVPLQLLDHIQSLSLPLEKFHISPRGETMTPKFLSRQLEICPLKDEFFTYDLPASIVQVLMQLPNFITTLEIAAAAQCGLDDTLHNYLCSSPHLLHLRAPKMEYQVNRMDFHSRLTDTNITKSGRYPALGQPQVWACSHLQTLHLKIYSLSEGASWGPNFNEQGRVMFGYISRVTPRLRDLYLNLPQYLASSHTPPRLCLKSGLCLLTRLTRLERLRVAGDLTRQVEVPEDIEWMLQSGHSLDMRERRRVIVAGWDAQIEEEARKPDIQQVELQQQQQQQQQQRQQQEPPVISSELAEQLQNLGRLVDVKEMIEEMDSKEGFPYWSELRRVSLFSESEFGFSIERECQKELARLALASTETNP
ncbi:hypothetical protein BGZ90_001443 [Linnemannia elongata]|nr:hypothetical protein BGZ90_001443 [Linnemannia elongata]